MIRQLKECLKANMYNEAVYLVRFLSDLVNCHVIAAPSMVAMFENFVSVTQEEDVPQVRCDWYVFAFLSSLPWVGKELYEKKDAEMDRILSQTESYLKRRQKIHVPMLQVWSADKPHPQEEYLDCLWAQIQKLKKDRWQERHILRPYLAFDSILCEALQHNLPPFTPPPHTEDSVYPMPRVLFRMFDYTDDPEGPVMPGSHSVERFVIEENLHCIIKSHWKERKTCAAQLLSYPGNNKIPLNYHIVEVVFAELFQLPVPPHIEVMYTTLLIELCKLQPGSLPQVLAQATEMLYMRLDTMNTTCIDRFMNWFSHHLSNFQFRWSWEDWSDCLTHDLDKPKPKFVREVLEKCMRLSYHQRIIDIVPATFSVLSPANPSCIYKYGDESNKSLPGYTVALCLTIAIKNKTSNDEIFGILKDVPNPNQDDDDASRLPNLVEWSSPATSEQASPDVRMPSTVEALQAARDVMTMPVPGALPLSASCSRGKPPLGSPQSPPAQHRSRERSRRYSLSSNCSGRSPPGSSSTPTRLSGWVASDQDSRHCSMPRSNYRWDRGRPHQRFSSLRGYRSRSQHGH
ncbi:Nuclear cap-binding protein subunit 1 [Chelonia mydas]|uniref:Nuclear cap-binding protein subunit 1 n=1 Tax=Chelonia mydas TaxID=8469 RepID=M7CA91_CHEMY|nr:Nuclear cap-binding protein subunit 1 [Chelonia mydas]